MTKVFDKIKNADWSGLKSVVSKGAPLLGSLLGGPVGGVAGTLLGSLLGTDGSDPKKLLAAISSDPEAMIKIQELESREKIRLQELVIESEKEYLSDRQNARAREASVVKSTGVKDWNLYILAWSVIAGFFGLVGVLMFVELPNLNIGPVNQLFGAMAAGFGMVLAYFFGSSKSSSDKTKMLGK